MEDSQIPIERSQLRAEADIILPTTQEKPPLRDGLLGIKVSPQKEQQYILVPAFEVSSDSDGIKKKWPYSRSCVWYAPTNPAILDEIILLEKAIRSKGEMIPSEILDELESFDPSKYSDSTRITRQSLIDRREEIDLEIRKNGVPSAKVVRYDDKKVKTNAIYKTKTIAVSTYQLNSQHTFRVQMNEKKGQYVDLHFDGQGNYAGCAFLCGRDVVSKTKFSDNFMSKNFNKGAMMGVLQGLEGFTINGVDVRSKISESLKVAKTPEQVQDKEDGKAGEKAADAKAKQEEVSQSAHNKFLRGRPVDFGGKAGRGV